MGYLSFKLSHEGFLHALGRGFLLPPLSSFDFVDMKEYCSLLDIYQKDKKRIKISSTLSQLENRMSKEYFDKVFIAQMKAMQYASMSFPSYTFILAEDLAEDWLATVDFHKSFARDHSLHQPLTAYIVAELLGYGDPQKALKIPVYPYDLLSFCTKSIFSSCDYILEYAREVGLPDSLLKNNKASRVIWRDFFYKTALLSALFHDLGYPWQYLGRINHPLEKSVETLGLSTDSIPRMIEQYKHRLIFLPFRHYKRLKLIQPSSADNEMKRMIKKALGTHGFPGGIAFLELSDAIRKYPSPSKQSAIHDLSIEWAAMGIIMHDMVRLHKEDFPSLRIDFAKDPLSSIVTLADFLEEFDRPNVEFEQREKNSLIKYSVACSDIDVSLQGRKLEVIMRYCTEGQLASANHFKKEETDDYFDPELGYLDMSSIGINQVIFKPIL